MSEVPIALQACQLQNRSAIGPCSVAWISPLRRANSSRLPAPTGPARRLCSAAWAD